MQRSPYTAGHASDEILNGLEAMRCLLALPLLVAFAGCERPHDTRAERKAAVSDIGEVLDVLIGEGHQVEAWRSNNKPKFVFVEGLHTPDLMFTDQDYKDFVDRANEEVDRMADGLIPSEENLLDVLADENNSAEEQENTETTWFVVKYRIRGGAPSIFVKVSKGNVGAGAKLGMKEKETDDSERKTGLSQQFSITKFRVAYPHSDRIL